MFVYYNVYLVANGQPQEMRERMSLELKILKKETWLAVKTWILTYLCVHGGELL